MNPYVMPVHNYMDNLPPQQPIKGTYLESAVGHRRFRHEYRADFQPASVGRFWLSVLMHEFPASEGYEIGTYAIIPHVAPYSIFVVTQPVPDQKGDEENIVFLGLCLRGCCRDFEDPETLLRIQFECRPECQFIKNKDGKCLVGLLTAGMVGFFTYDDKTNEVIRLPEQDGSYNVLRECASVSAIFQSAK